MNILVAPSAYKGTLSATQVANAIVEGARLACPDAGIESVPIADGGDGTIDAIRTVLSGKMHDVEVHGALGQEIRAHWFEWKDIGIVELASASGLGHLIGQLPSGIKLDAMRAHTLGTGEVLSDCLQFGMKKIVVCVGGSASTDGGSGLLRALGAKIFDKDGAELSPGGAALGDIVSCDLTALSKWNLVDLSVATDVTSPLLGTFGAAKIFAPQKGASPQQVVLLESALARFATVLEMETGRSIRNLPGAGAAGGTAFGLACAMGAKIVPGFSWLSQLLSLELKVEKADIVITAEGCLDEQSMMGKASGELALLCCKYEKPLYAVPAISRLSLDWQKFGVSKLVPICPTGGIATPDQITACVARLLSAN